MINTFVYSVYGQFGGTRHKDDPLIADYRHQWLDALLVGKSITVVVLLGSLAEAAFGTWKATPAGQSTDVAFRRIFHPTYPEGQRTKPRAEATAELLQNWNEALAEFRPRITEPDFEPTGEDYGDAFDEERDLAAIPERDLPAGLPDWMRSLRSWALRQAVNTGDPVEEKRATLVARVPKVDRAWLQADPPPAPPG
jgi:hypothetical protein